MTPNDRITHLSKVVAAAINKLTESDSSTEFVSASTQTLSADQQSTVRGNIGAASATDTHALSASLDALKSVIESQGSQPGRIADEDFASAFVASLADPSVQAAAKAALPSDPATPSTLSSPPASAG